ncbi:hypothetical protein ACRPK6_13920 [Exiguobacterium sp. TRN 1102]|uniref:hypothetical protein n=1 Tax=Exiguobacterium sp. TRN 1102 TaxID=3420732 RepID=UPI003D785FF9
MIESLALDVIALGIFNKVSDKVIYREAKRILENTSLESNLDDLKYKLVQKLIKIDEEKEGLKQPKTGSSP